MAKGKTGDRIQDTGDRRQEPVGSRGPAPGFFEIVNWKKPQPTIKKVKSADWMKLYTSLLDHDGFAALDYQGRNTVICLWLYAARTGIHIFPNDPAWLLRKIPLLGSEPSLAPLFEAKDIYGRATPFIAACQPPSAKKAAAKKSREKRTDQNREEKREESRRTLTGSREKERKRKERVAQQQKDSTKKKEAESPKNPKETEAGSAKVFHVPKPARSGLRNRGPQRVGDILDERFPEHWRDPDAQEFGWEIAEALGMERNPHNSQIASEWGAFASFWCRIKARASPMLLGELRSIANEKAEFVNSPKCKRVRNKSATWTDIMYKELDHHGIQMPRKSSKSG